MPLYEYECTSCHRRTEKIQKFSDAELTVCPHCGGRLERTITAAAVSFKGGGWYKDLYSSAKPAAASSEAAGSGTSGGADSGSESGGKVDSVAASTGSSEESKPSESAKPAAAAPAPAPAASSSTKD
jgi:putative FmdB family regulatory protein